MTKLQRQFVVCLVVWFSGMGYLAYESPLMADVRGGFANLMHKTSVLPKADVTKAIASAIGDTSSGQVAMKPNDVAVLSQRGGVYTVKTVKLVNR